ncbi:hypothetical protein ACFOZ0_30805 [Streptomyces yaanensis]|uniref:Uncharacterized protein n=1 Tax=Streptomyces yaanensis TaxID=1142239 RepID=A0ABV7SLI1_9ACTN|nr:hypothetical protein [Streptomyces sp. CGMCC 4.7035]WNC01870.1 hypothetical protein Q2K21_29525 [Streptomyces sp. CGMCC 4.7035]
MSVIPFPERPPAPCPVDPLESALLSAWNNAPEVMDGYRDEDAEGTADTGQDR